ncbi:unnamed protein product [Meganyctiphanes norvegica]|uniref:Uncharacterized protein n=1 Tax=Meganyctiphanes norvegica TaxID=48144 RepID=A0AAV2QWD7_MEGNR
MGKDNDCFCPIQLRLCRQDIVCCSLLINNKDAIIWQISLHNVVQTVLETFIELGLQPHKVEKSLIPSFHCLCINSVTKPSYIAKFRHPACNMLISGKPFVVLDNLETIVSHLLLKWDLVLVDCHALPINESALR